MPQIRTRSRRFEGAGHARAYRGASTVNLPGSPTIRVLDAVVTLGTRTCPSCQLVTALRADGSLKSHRVGSRSFGWPCPGEDAAPRS